MKEPAMKSTLILAIATLTLGACDRNPEAELRGTYALMSVNGAFLPVQAACSNYQVVEGEIILAPHFVASYHLRWLNPASGDVRSYDASGVYRVEDDVVELTVSGRWSNLSQSYTDRFSFEILEEGSMGIELSAPFGLLRQGVGAECDASNEELYVRQPS
jgi:hypothetical protein